MRTIPFVRWIANAAACLTGPHGAVTEKAQEAGCSRQSAYDHAQKVLAAVESQHSGGPAREELIRQNEALRRENAQLWDWLFQTIEFPPAKQREFAVTALAMGLSLNQVLVLLAILLGIRRLPVARLCIGGPKPPARPPARSSSDWTRRPRPWSSSVVSTRSSSAADRSWSGWNPTAWSGSWGRRPTTARGRRGSANCDPGPRCAGSSAMRDPDCGRVSPRSVRSAAPTRGSRCRWRRGWMSSTPSGRPSGS